MPVSTLSHSPGRAPLPRPSLGCIHLCAAPRIRSARCVRASRRAAPCCAWPVPLPHTHTCTHARAAQSRPDETRWQESGTFARHDQSSCLVGIKTPSGRSFATPLIPKWYLAHTCTHPPTHAHTHPHPMSTHASASLHLYQPTDQLHSSPQVTGSHDCQIRLWDLAAGKTMSTLTNHKKVSGLS